MTHTPPKDNIHAPPSLTDTSGTSALPPFERQESARLPLITESVGPIAPSLPTYHPGSDKASTSRRRKSPASLFHPSSTDHSGSDGASTPKKETPHRISPPSLNITQGSTDILRKTDLHRLPLHFSPDGSFRGRRSQPAPPRPPDPNGSFREQRRVREKQSRPTPPRPLLRCQDMRLRQQESPVKQRRGQRTNYVAPVEPGSAVPAPALAPQADAPQGVRGRFQPGPWRQRSPLPLPAGAPLTETTIPTLLTRLQRIIPDLQQHLGQGIGQLPQHSDNTILPQP